MWEHHKIEFLKIFPDFEFQPMQKIFLKTKIESKVPYFTVGKKPFRQISKLGRFHHVAKNIPRRILTFISSFVPNLATSSYG